MKSLKETNIFNLVVFPRTTFTDVYIVIDVTAADVKLRVATVKVPSFIIVQLIFLFSLASWAQSDILYIEGWAQDYGNSNIFLKPLFRGNLDPFVNNANLGAIAHTSNGT